MAPDAQDGGIRRVRRWPAWLAWGVCLVLLAGSAWYVSGPLAVQRGWLIEGGEATVNPELIAGIHPDPANLGAGVADPARIPSAAAADRGRVGAALAATPPDLPGSYSGAVADLGGGGLLYDLDSGRPMIPASTLKVMTGLAVLDTLGADATFTTRVVLAGSDHVVLVGGGDPMLASTAGSHPYHEELALPSTEALVVQTAERLRSQGIARVTVGYDDSLFAQDSWHATWPAGDRTFVAPITALSVDGGAAAQELTSPSVPAAQTFADQLRQAGIEVAGTPAPAPAGGGAELASVDSAPLGLIVQQLLVHSDNYLAEMLLRQLAIAEGQPATFAGGAGALTARLTALGLWYPGQQIVDGSGLSTDNRLTTMALIGGLQLAAERSELGWLLAGLPVGCATGTLANRFTDEASAAGRGQVRAKTGTLDRVSALAGYTTTSDGGLLAFAFVGNDLPADRDVRPWFDHVGAALAGCDCVA